VPEPVEQGRHQQATDQGTDVADDVEDRDPCLRDVDLGQHDHRKQREQPVVAECFRKIE